MFSDKVVVAAPTVKVVATLTLITSSLVNVNMFSDSCLKETPPVGMLGFMIGGFVSFLSREIVVRSTETVVTLYCPFKDSNCVEPDIPSSETRFPDFNKYGLVFSGQRLDNPNDSWQLPQGGIDENENPEEAVWREMMEEIGTNKASLIASSKEWISYDIPSEILSTLPWGNEYMGQIQKWFLFNFNGDDRDINVGTENPEFSDWKWMNYDEITHNAVPFKKNVYQKIQSEFKKVLTDV